MMKKIWLSIDEQLIGLANNIEAIDAEEETATSAYCYHCGEDFGYKQIDGSFFFKPVNLIQSCQFCGQINNPHARVYVEAFDAQDGEPLEYFISASTFFAKSNFDEYLSEYDKEGHLSFIVKYK